MDFEHFIYKGYLLPDYCELIKISLQQIKNLYRRLRRTKKHSAKTNEELLTYLLDHLNEMKLGVQYKLWYHGIPLMIWCQMHTEYAYDTLVAVITAGQEADPTKSVDDILDEYFAKEHKSYIR